MKPKAELSKWDNCFNPSWPTFSLMINTEILCNIVASEKEATTEGGLSDAEVEDLIQQRQDARANKDYAEGDRLRDVLVENDIVIIDKPGGMTEWRRK